MAEIKLPVTTKFDEHLGWLYDAAGDLVLRAVGAESANLHPIAAALNAAPTTYVREKIDGLSDAALIEFLGLIADEVAGQESRAEVWNERAEEQAIASAGRTALIKLLASDSAKPPAAPQAPQLQPIETAPRDGSPVLVKFRDGARRAWPELGLTGASRSGCRVMRRDGLLGWRDDAVSGLGGISDEWLAGWAPLPQGDVQ